MPRAYRHIKQYKKEIGEMWKRGFTKREIGKKIGMSKEQIKGFLRRQKQEQRKLVAGITVKKKGSRRWQWKTN